MDEHVDSRRPAQDGWARRGPSGPGLGLRPLRLPSPRASALLATLTLGVGIAVGAAIGPAPDVSFAGSGAETARRLLLQALLAHERSGTPTVERATPASGAPSGAPEAAEPTATPAKGSGSSASQTSGAKEEAAPGGEESKPRETTTSKSSLPPISNVWLIELSGGGFQAVLAQPNAAPFIAQTVPQGALLSGWSSLSASAFASEAALAVPPAEGAAPPLLHSIVQPPCPEGAAGQARAPETPGQLTTADEFLKTTLATITGTPAYREHGLVVITFTTVGLPAQAGLPEGASSATLTHQPPAGVLLLSPFAAVGSKPSIAFDPTSPRKSLEQLLHK